LKRNTSEDQDFIRSYFRKISLKICENESQFWAHILQKHGRKLKDSLIQALYDREEQENDDEFYELKNQSLQLSLDFSSYSGDLYRKYFEWMLHHKNLKAKRILDIGCDNGIVTCFYATLFPESEVVGIDIGENAIKCAWDLAKKLELKNVTFKKMDFLKLGKEFPKEHFQLISSLRSIHEIIGSFPELRYWSINELKFEEGGETENKAFVMMNHLLSRQEGYLITGERLPDIGSSLWFVEKFKREQLHLHELGCEFIEFHEIGEAQRIPIFIFSKNQTKIDAGQRLRDLYTKDVRLTLDHNELLDDYPAETFFDELFDKKLIYGVQINFNEEPASMRIELWQQEEVLYQYTYSNMGYREIKKCKENKIVQAKKKLKLEALGFSFGGNQILYYNDLKQRKK
jgi:SAM-dependent methyltransferase